MDGQIDVSIICIAYNHEKYIRQCLDGFVMQKGITFEIIIHDDASTDKTADIIREYEKKYPNLFKPIYQTENQYSKHVNIAQKYMVPLITGKYVAFCEGDDYWTDPYKLKKQFDALEANPDCYVCFHDVEIVNEDGSLTGKHVPYYNIDTGYMTSAQFFESYKNTRYFHTSSFFFLAEKYIEYREYPPKFRQVSPVGDEPDILYFAYIGSIYYISECMSHYRFLSIGSWSSRFHANNEEAWIARETHIIKMREFLNQFLIYSNNQYNSLLAFKLDEIDHTEKYFKDDRYWYYIGQKNYRQIFKNYSIKEIKSYGSSNKEILKMKLQAIFGF